jgi:hypothetical protein
VGDDVWRVRDVVMWERSDDRRLSALCILLCDR